MSSTHSESNAWNTENKQALTEKEYFALPVEEKDALVAEHLMGLEVIKERLLVDWFDGERYININENDVYGILRPIYITDTNRTWYPERKYYSNQEYYERTLARYKSDVARFGAARMYLAGVPEYNENVAFTWKVVEKFRANNALITIHNDVRWWVEVEVVGEIESGLFYAAHDNISIAICAAALKSRGVIND